MMRFSLTSLLVLSLAAFALAKKPQSPRSFTNFNCPTLGRLEKCADAIVQAGIKKNLNIIVSTELDTKSGTKYNLDNICDEVIITKLAGCRKCLAGKCVVEPVPTPKPTN